MPPKRKLSEKSTTPIKRAKSAANVLATEKRRSSVAPREVRTRKTTEGVVLTCGQGDVGQLGLGPDVLDKAKFVLVPELDKVVDIAVGGMHTVCLTSEGRVYTFGCDDEGALGREATDESSMSPGLVSLKGNAVQISAGDNHSAALLEDGSVFAWGCFRDSHGPMGLLEEKSSKLPRHLAGLPTIEKITSGSDHLVLMSVTGQLYSCGCPEQGQLGRVTARSASRDTIRKGMSAFLFVAPINFRRRVVFTDIWATSFGTFAVDRNDSVYICGLNNYHQLDPRTIEAPIWSPVHNSSKILKNENWKKITGGDHHTLLLNDKGKVFCLGRKDYGRLGLGDGSGDADDVTPIPALKDHSCVDIACGSAVSFAVTSEGQLYGWGMGSNGQLSRGSDDEDQWNPTLLTSKALEKRKVLLVDAGGQHTVILATAI